VQKSGRGLARGLQGRCKKCAEGQVRDFARFDNFVESENKIVESGFSE
jgi:uncharacterized protein (DUF983 family)